MEFNVDKQIKDYWDKFVGLTDSNNEEFADATSENSVRASKFLAGLNLDPIMPEINKHYTVKEGLETYPRRAMVRTFIWRNIKTIKYYTKTERNLKNHPDEALELGFNIDLDGNAIVPDHETLRHFEKIRLGNEGMDAIMELFCITVVETGNKLGLKIGKNTGTDSTPIKTHNDPDGKYNGHYKKEMVKAHITMDYDYNIPLAKKVCGGTEDDDKYLEEMLRKTAVSAKKNMEETWYDGGYNSLKNIALSHIEFGLIPHYHIDKDWRENVSYEHRFGGKIHTYTPEKEINYIYRKHWKDSNYKKDASFEYMMQYLVKIGIYEPVAMYFRNKYMRQYEECPDGVLDVYHMRNCNEGINSYLKDHLEVETHVNGKGLKNLDIHVTKCCITLLAVALTRLQKGIKENISSVAYLT
ncbi:Uncharacterised protein [uncultured archaeon]|nr:Uncharacterised protein [uncultured archaeon]